MKMKFRNGIHSLLSRANARRSVDIIYRICDACCQFAVWHCELRHKVGHAQLIHYKRIIL